MDVQTTINNLSTACRTC